MKRVFKTRHFCRWMRGIELTDNMLCNAVEEMKTGLIDADLGGGVFKKRVSLPGRGKSGSTRTLLATNKSDRWFFLIGFEKNKRDNITKGELEILKQAASDWLSFDDALIQRFLVKGSLEEICYEKNV